MERRQSKGQVRADLAGGSILIFTALESRDGKLIGHSSLYGDVAIPTDSIQYLYMGDLERKTLSSPFEQWGVFPARVHDKSFSRWYGDGRP